MTALAFIGTIQHDISKDDVKRLIGTIREDVSYNSLIVCNADGLFLNSSKLDEQIELLFDSGIDLISVGEQAISRNCCRSFFSKSEWAVIKALNLPGSSSETSIKKISLKEESFWFISTTGQNGKIPVDYSYIKIDEFFQNKNDVLPVIIIESNAEYKYLQALAWRYSNKNCSVLVLGVGTGFVTSPSLKYSDNCLFQYDLGSVVTENTICGFDPELWWRKNIERRPITLIPKWGNLSFSYTVVNIEEGKIKNFYTKSEKA